MNPMQQENSLDVRAGLEKMRDDQLRKLAALASNKKEAERLLREIQVLDRALASYVTPDGAMKYGRFKSAIAAILAYLDDVGHPISQDELIAGLIDGGWQRGETDLKRSIASFITGLGRKTKQIKQMNGLIGRGDWEDAKFRR
jgi:hypothetical protein